MKAERPIKMNGAIGWMAATLLIVWLGGFSATAATHSACCKRATNTVNRPNCCEQNQSCGNFTGCDSGAPQESSDVAAVAANDVLTGIPPNDSTTTWRIAKPTTISGSFSRTAVEPSIPAELRLGSALWSHAPPTRVA